MKMEITEFQWGEGVRVPYSTRSRDFELKHNLLDHGARGGSSWKWKWCFLCNNHDSCWLPKKCGMNSQHSFLHYITQRAIMFLKKLILAQLINKFPEFYRAEGSLPCLQTLSRDRTLNQTSQVCTISFWMHTLLKISQYHIRHHIIKKSIDWISVPICTRNHAPKWWLAVHFRWKIYEYNPLLVKCHPYPIWPLPSTKFYFFVSNERILYILPTYQLRNSMPIFSYLGSSTKLITWRW
jgi:hypothetical protein